MKRVYHYTTKDSLLKILSSKQFNASMPWTKTDDSTFGPGWYFTYREPHSFDEELAQLWGKEDLEHGEATAYLVYEIHEVYLKSYEDKGRPDVFKLEYDIIAGDHLDISTPYQHETEIVIKFIQHGYRENKKAKPKGVKQEDKYAALKKVAATSPQWTSEE